LANWRISALPPDRKRRPSAGCGKIGQVTESNGGAHSRRRRRASSRQGPPPASAAVEPPVEAPAEPVVEAEAAPQKRQRPSRPPRDLGERGLADLVGGGRSQLGVSGALRGRDVNRPTEQDLAEAERDVVIVRRNWKPTP